MSSIQSRRTIGNEIFLEQDGSDRRFRKMLYDFFAFSENLGQVRSLFASCVGLSATQYQILIVVSRHQANGGSIGVARVAEELRLSGTLITTETNKLAQQGLLEKHPNPEDKRRVLLEITAKGLNMLDELAAVQRPINDALFEQLNREEFEQLSSILERLAQSSTHAIHLAHHLTSQKKIEP